MELIAILIGGLVAGVVQIGKRTGLPPLFLVALLAITAAALWEIWIPSEAQTLIIAKAGVIITTAVGIYELFKRYFPARYLTQKLFSDKK